MDPRDLRNESQRLKSYLDAKYAGCKERKRSTTRWFSGVGGENTFVPLAGLNVSDVFTKPLERAEFSELVMRRGIWDLRSSK